MAFYEILNPVFNPLFQPIINRSPFLGLVILAVIISLLITLVYKFFTNQEKMKAMKEQQKDFQKKMKELRSNPPEMMKVQKEAMKVNMDYMKSSFKPTLITMIPILLIFGWMAAHLSYEPLLPGMTYEVNADFMEGLTGSAELVVDNSIVLVSDGSQEIENNQASWKFKAKEKGERLLTIKTDTEEKTKKILVTTVQEYIEPLENYENSEIKQINVVHNKLKPLKNIGIPWVSNWGWLGWYIVLSLIFSMSLRKLLKIY
jgi:uncharacterized membrane protein (DUF106 family)